MQDGLDEVMSVALLVSVTWGELGDVGVNLGSTFKIPGGAQSPSTTEDKIGDCKILNKTLQDSDIGQVGIRDR